MTELIYCERCGTSYAEPCMRHANKRAYLAIIDKDGDERMEFELTDLDRVTLSHDAAMAVLAFYRPYRLDRVTITTERTTLEGA